MRKNFTKKFIYENSGCYDAEDINKYWPKGKTTIHLNDILNSGISIKDKYWFVCKKIATKRQNIMIAIGVAEIVLHLFEDKYPEDKRPRKAIESAKNYLKTKNKNAAAAAAAAAYADAAYAAAYAYAADAYAAATAADAAAYAADAAVYAAAAAAAAAYAADAAAAYDAAAAAYADAAAAAYADAAAAYADAADAADAAYTGNKSLDTILLKYLIDFCNNK